MGAVTAPKPISEDEWQQRATQSAIDAAKKVVGDGLNARASIGSLSDIEWGWIVAAVIFGWIETRAKQAVAEGRGYDEVIQSMPRDPAPWEAGAVASILPQLGNLKDVDWSKPVGEWSKEQIVSFSWQIHKLVDEALAQRDQGASGKIVTFSKDKAERNNSAAHGGGYMSRHDMDDEIPF